MTLRGWSAREMATVTSTELRSVEQPAISQPTGQTRGMAPQSRLHWSRAVSTMMDAEPLASRQTASTESYLHISLIISLVHDPSRIWELFIKNVVLTNLLQCWDFWSRSIDSALKKGMTLAELWCKASARAWQYVISTVLQSGETGPSGTQFSCISSGGSPMTTTVFISIRCRKDKPNARLCTIS